MYAERLVEAFRAALQEPPSIVERLRQGFMDPYARALALRDEYEASVKLARAEHRASPKGFRPDGTRVTLAEKKAAFALYEQRKAEHEARLGARRSPVYASARADELELPPGHVCPWW